MYFTKNLLFTEDFNLHRTLIFAYQKEESMHKLLIYGMVGNEGFEPPMPDSESGALPLGEFPEIIYYSRYMSIHLCERDCIERVVFCKFIFNTKKYPYPYKNLQFLEVFIDEVS